MGHGSGTAAGGERARSTQVKAPGQLASDPRRRRRVETPLAPISGLFYNVRFTKTVSITRHES